MWWMNLGSKAFIAGAASSHTSNSIHSRNVRDEMPMLRVSIPDAARCSSLFAYDSSSRLLHSADRKLFQSERQGSGARPHAGDLVNLLGLIPSAVRAHPPLIALPSAYNRPEIGQRKSACNAMARLQTEHWLQPGCQCLKSFHQLRSAATPRLCSVFRSGYAVFHNRSDQSLIKPGAGLEILRSCNPTRTLRMLQRSQLDPSHSMESLLANVSEQPEPPNDKPLPMPMPDLFSLCSSMDLASTARIAKQLVDGAVRMVAANPNAPDQAIGMQLQAQAQQKQQQQPLRCILINLAHVLLVIAAMRGIL